MLLGITNAFRMSVIDFEVLLFTSYCDLFTMFIELLFVIAFLLFQNWARKWMQKRYVHRPVVQEQTSLLMDVSSSDEDDDYHSVDSLSNSNQVFSSNQASADGFEYDTQFMFYRNVQPCCTRDMYEDPPEYSEF